MAESLQERLRRISSGGAGPGNAGLGGGSQIKKVLADIGQGEESDGGGLKARLARIDAAVSEENAPVDVGMWNRFKEKGFAANAEQAKGFWERELEKEAPGRGLTVEADPSVTFGTNYFIKNRLGETVGQTDPQGYQGLGELAKDTLVDLPIDVGRGAVGAAALAASEAPGIALAPFTGGASVVAAPALVGAATEGGLETARQGIGRLLGVNQEFDKSNIAINAALGGLIPGGAQALKAIKAGGVQQLADDMAQQALAKKLGTGMASRGINPEDLAREADLPPPKIPGLADGLPPPPRPRVPTREEIIAETLGKSRPEIPTPEELAYHAATMGDEPAGAAAAKGAFPFEQELEAGIGAAKSAAAETETKNSLKDPLRNIAGELVDRFKLWQASPQGQQVTAEVSQFADEMTRGETGKKSGNVLASTLGKVGEKTTGGQMTPESMLQAFKYLTPDEQMHIGQTVEKAVKLYAPLNDIIESENHWLPYAKAAAKLEEAQGALAAQAPETEGFKAAQKAVTQAQKVYDKLVHVGGAMPDQPEMLTPFVATSDDKALGKLVKTMNEEWLHSHSMGQKTKLGQEIVDTLREIEKNGGARVSEWANLNNLIRSATKTPIGNTRTTVGDSLGRAFSQLRDYSWDQMKIGWPEYAAARSKVATALTVDNARRGGHMSQMLRAIMTQNLAEMGLEAIAAGEAPSARGLVATVVGAMASSPRVNNYVIGAMRKLWQQAPKAAVSGLKGTAPKVAGGVASAAAPTVATESLKTINTARMAADAMAKGKWDIAQKIIEKDAVLQRLFFGTVREALMHERGQIIGKPIQPTGMEPGGGAPGQPQMPDFSRPPAAIPASAPPAGLTPFEESFLPPDPVQELRAQTGIQSIVLNDRGKPAVMDPAERPVLAKHAADDPGLDESEAALVTASVLQDGEIVTPQEIWDRRRAGRRRPLGGT